MQAADSASCSEWEKAMTRNKELKMDVAEVFDTTKEAAEFLKMNKIKKCKIIVTWNEYEGSSWERNI